jgi:hypothetical protein
MSQCQDPLWCEVPVATATPRCRWRKYELKRDVLMEVYIHLQLSQIHVHGFTELLIIAYWCTEQHEHKEKFAYEGWNLVLQLFIIYWEMGWQLTIKPNVAMKANAKDVFIVVHARYEDPCDNTVLIQFIHKMYVIVITKSNIKAPSSKLDIDSTDFTTTIPICENNITLLQVQCLFTNSHNL